MSDAESAVLEANATFYEAFAARDLEAMEAAWSTGELVCVHPGWPPIRGHREVLHSWRSIFENDDGPTPQCEAPSCRLAGDSAVVTCRERLGGAILVATNVFALEDGRWRMVHHQASALARVPATPEMDPDLLPN